MKKFSIYVDDVELLSVTPPLDSTVGMAMVIFADDLSSVPYEAGISYNDERPLNCWLRKRLPLRARLRVQCSDSLVSVCPAENEEVADKLSLEPSATPHDLVAFVKVGNSPQQEFHLDGASRSHFLIHYSMPSNSNADLRPSFSVSFFGVATNSKDIREFVKASLNEDEFVELCIDNAI